MAQVAHADALNERNVDSKPKSRRGFASMSPEKRSKIASIGGKAAHAQGRAHEYSSDEARIAGRLGGKAVSKDRLHMAKIGRMGGRARGANMAARAKDA